MKANLKGGNAIVRLLLAHGEKLGMLVILTCAGWLLWSAMNVSRLESGKDPATLTNLSQQADQHIKSFTHQMIAEAAPDEVLDAKAPNVESMKPPTKQDFPNISVINRPVIQPVGPRTDPVLLPPEDLEVNSDAGLWASANPEQIEQRQLEAAAKAQKEKQEMEAQQARDRDENDDSRGRGGRGRRGRGGRDDERGRDEAPTRGRNDPIVVPPQVGIALQGFETVRPQSWVTVLAKVPVEAEYQMYDDALQSARGYEPQRDIPIYLGYVVERAEVTNKGQSDWKALSSVMDETLKEELATYPVNPPEVVASRFVHPLLTHPLPPLILKEWDNRVSHSSMPLAAEDAMLEAEKLEKATEKPAKTEGDEEDEGFGSSRMANNQLGPRGGEFGGGYGGGYGGEGGYGGGRGGYGGEGGYGGGRGGYGGGYGGEGGYGGGYGGEGGYGGGYGGGRGGGYGLGAGSGVEIADFVWDHKTSNALLRFFDNTVEPGHRYRYRVRLALADVNNRVSLSYLDPSVNQRREKLSKKQKRFRLTDWSKPSPVASVPLPARIYLASAEPAKETSYNSEPEADMIIKALNSEYAAEIAIKETFVRGSVMNLFEKAMIIWSNRYPQNDPEFKAPDFDFRTGATVIDMRGGEDLSSRNRDLVAPAWVVLMDAAGKLSIHNEMKDEPAVEQFDAIIEQGHNERSRGGFGGEGGYGGRGGRGGRGGF